jgi:hypothetical protein
VLALDVSTGYAGGVDRGHVGLPLALPQGHHGGGGEAPQELLLASSAGSSPPARLGTVARGVYGVGVDVVGLGIRDVVGSRVGTAASRCPTRSRASGSTSSGLRRRAAPSSST